MKKHLFFFLLALAIPAASPAKSAIDTSYGHIPLAFTLNKGQMPSTVHFTARGRSSGIDFSSTGITFLLSREKQDSAAKRASGSCVILDDQLSRYKTGHERFTVKLSFVGANANPVIQGEERLPWNNNYFIGDDPDKWRTDVPNYRRKSSPKSSVKCLSDVFVCL